MANKRMFSLDVVDTDLFLEMPVSSQALYFQLGMRADDDGVVSSPRKIIKLTGCATDDLKILISKGYVIPFESGVVVVTHWRVNNNQIRSDRYKASRYQEEVKSLEVKDGTYQVSTKCLPDAYQVSDSWDVQNRIDKNRIDKSNKNNVCASVPDGTKKAPDKTKKEASELFEKVWALYPSKKGKGQVSDTQKKKLLKIGEEELTRAIERYKADLSRDEWRKPQNGSTFFNSGYVDYLDENWQAGADSSDTEDDAAAWERARAEMERLASIGPRVDGPF